MTQTTDITVLDHLTAVNLAVNIWTARKKLVPGDFGNADLPPEELASLGSKKICNPDDLRIFSTLKARAVSLLNRRGVRFLGGWAIPSDQVDEINNELKTIRKAFVEAKEQFLARYDDAIRDWIDQHPGWRSLLGGSIVSANHVRSRIDFKWQMFRLLPPTQNAQDQGLHDELKHLGGTLYGEVAKAATDTWHRCYEGKTQVTHKALSPLRSIHQKLTGLGFIDPRALPITDLLQTAFDQIPKRGHIDGPALLMLQGVVALLRDPVGLVEHGQKILDGHSTGDLLDALVAAPSSVSVATGDGDGGRDGGEGATANSFHNEQRINSHGLW